MNITLIEPYYGGSHKFWADSFKKYSRHCVNIISLPSRFWKWRMQGSALHFAKIINNQISQPDLFLVSGMIDLALLKSLLPKFFHIPFYIFMHENQLSYPLSQLDKQANIDLSYGYLNFKSCLAADKVFFNSIFHQESFLKSLESLLRKMPDYNCLEYLNVVKAKSYISYLGIDTKLISSILKNRQSTMIPTLLWNHRWSFDKNPEMFYKLLCDLVKSETKFKLIVTHSDSDNKTLTKIKKQFSHLISHNKYINNYSEYIKVISQANIIPVTSNHDFFGLSVLEAIYCGLSPILPNNLVYTELYKSNFPSSFYNSYEELLAKTLKEIDTIKNLKNRIKYNKSSLQNLDIVNSVNELDNLFH